MLLCISMYAGLPFASFGGEASQSFLYLQCHPTPLLAYMAGKGTRAGKVECTCGDG
jgi:hypothetical protein